MEVGESAAVVASREYRGTLVLACTGQEHVFKFHTRSLRWKALGLKELGFEELNNQYRLIEDDVRACDYGILIRLFTLGLTDPIPGYVLEADIQTNCRRLGVEVKLAVCQAK